MLWLAMRFEKITIGGNEMRFGLSEDKLNRTEHSNI